MNHINSLLFNRISLILIAIWGLISSVYAQSDSIDIYNLDFSQLSKLTIITAGKTTEKSTEVSSTTLIISSGEIMEKGYFTLDEVLSDLPGFQLRNIQSYNSYIFQRGIPSQNNLILLLIDGIQINELNSGGFYGGGTYNLSNIERIEVIYGPSSVVYGTNAISGIINIITKNPQSKQFQLNAMAGNFNTFSGDLYFSQISKNNKFGIQVSGMYKQSEKAELSGRAGDYNWTNSLENYENDYAGGVKIKAGSFLFGLNVMQKQSSASTYVKSVGTVHKDHGSVWNIRFLNTYLKYKHIISDKTELKSTIYHRNASVLDNSILYVTDTAQIGYYRPNHLLGIENIIHYKKSDFFQVTGGLIAEYERIAKSFSVSFSPSAYDIPHPPSKPEMNHNTLFSFFLEPKIHLGKKLLFASGIRFDKSSVYQTVFTPRVGLIFNLDPFVIRLNYAQAFRAPKPWDYYDGLGNSGLLPEKLNSFETSISALISKNFKISLISYYNLLNNALVKEVITDNYRWVNEGQIKTSGLECTLKYQKNHFKAYLNYTFTYSTNAAGKAIPEIAKHTSNSGISYSFIKDLIINVRANFADKKENPVMISNTNSKFVDPYLILNSGIAFSGIDRLTLRFFVRNVLNAEYYHTSNLAPERYRQAQRNYLLSISYKLNDFK